MEPNPPLAAFPLRFASRVLKITAFVAAFALTMELCARVDDVARYGAPFWGEYSNERLTGRDPLGFRYNLPHARFQKWQHNSLGFRGAEVARHKAPGITRIVCLGSSESYGLYESPGKEWPSQLKEMLPTSRYEVVNGSVVGLGLKGFKGYLQKHLLPLQPDVVVLVVNPLFYVTSQSKAQKAEASADPAAPPKKSPKEWLVANSRLLPKVKAAVKAAVSTNFPRAFKRYELAQMQKEVRELELARLKGRRGMDAVPPSYLANFKKDLRETVALIRSHGAEVVLTSYPALICRENLATHPEIFLDNRRFCIDLSLDGIMNSFSAFNAVVAEVSRETGVPFVDAQRRVPKTLEYFRDNVHYTDSGAREFAATVSTALQGQAGMAGYSWRKNP